MTSKIKLILGGVLLVLGVIFAVSSAKTATPTARRMPHLPITSL